MPSVIYFVGGGKLAVKDDAARVVSYLRSGWGEVALPDETSAHVNGGNVLFVRDESEEPGDFLFESYG